VDGTDRADDDTGPHAAETGSDGRHRLVDDRSAATV
jgi:hypothetical protein